MEETTQQPDDSPKGKLTVTAVVKRADGTIEDLGVIGEGWVGFEVSSGPS